MFCLFIRKSNGKAENAKLIHINFHFVLNTSIKTIFFEYKNDYNCAKPQT